MTRTSLPIAVVLSLCASCGNEATPRPIPPASSVSSAASAAASSSSTPPPALPAAPADVIIAIIDAVQPYGFEDRSAADVSRALEDAARHARPEEQALVARARRMADESGGAKPSKTERERHIEAYVALLQDAAALRPDDPELAAMVAGTIGTMVNVARAAGLGNVKRDARWRRDAFERAEATARRFPTSVRANLARSELCPGADEDDLVCLRDVVECLEVDPANKVCKRDYPRRAKAYAVPACKDKDLRSGLGLVVGTKMPRPDTRKMDTPHGPLHVDKRPSFVVADFSRAEMKISIASDNGVVTLDERGAGLVVRPDRRLAFGEWLEKAAAAAAKDDELHLVILDGSTWVHGDTFQRGSVPELGIWTSDLELKTLCTRTERRTLPPGLPPP